MSVWLFTPIFAAIYTFITLVLGKGIGENALIQLNFGFIFGALVWIGMEKGLLERTGLQYQINSVHFDKGLLRQFFYFIPLKGIDSGGAGSAFIPLLYVANGQISGITKLYDDSTKQFNLIGFSYSYLCK